MIYKLLLWLMAVGSCLFSGTIAYQMNMTRYFEMPALYDFDDYDRCLQDYSNRSTYCFVRVQLQEPVAAATHGADVWRTIVELTRSNRHHLDHRHLYYGLCVGWCAEVLAQLPANATDALYLGLLTNNSKVNTYLGLFTAEAENRDRYNRLLNQCVNLRLQEQAYGLQATTMIEYCDTNRPEALEQDNWNLTFQATFSVLVGLLTLSSFYDLYLKHKRNDKMLTDRDHYKAAPSRIVDQALVIFSVARNWYRLTQEPDGRMGRDLRFLDCFKFCSMFLVIFAHTNWVIYEAAITNPQDPERLQHTLAGTLLASGSLITVTFFVISGFLLTLNWLAVLKVKADLKPRQYIAIFVAFNVFRYIRLTIPYAFVLLLSGVYFENPGGPMWRHIVEREQLSCRKNWWANLLYVNNFVNNNERCMLQSWYLSADTHSFIVSLMVLMIAHKWPKVRNYLFGAVVAFSHIIPAVVTYAVNYRPIFIASPQSQRDSFIEDDLFSGFYAPAYMNFGCYFYGVLAAFVYDQLATKKFQLRQYKAFHVIWYTTIPIGILWLFSSHPIFQHYYDHQPLFWDSLFAAVHRNMWGFGLTVIIIGMAVKVGWVLRKFACLPIFRILGRLTYGVFVLHLLVARIALATIRQPIYFGTSMMFAFIVFTMTVSYLASFVLAILVELPVSASLKLLRK